jgi:hypothetical protein
MSVTPYPTLRLKLTPGPSLKIRLAPQTALQCRVKPGFPGTVSGQSPIIVTSGGGNYDIGIDMAALRASLVDMSSAAIEVAFDGNGSVFPIGLIEYIEVPFKCQINRVTLLADKTGSVTIDIWKCSFAQFDGGATHPVVADSITASAAPAIVSNTDYQDDVLTGWNTNIDAGDVLAFNVKVGPVNITRVTASLKLTRIS